MEVVKTCNCTQGNAGTMSIMQAEATPPFTWLASASMQCRTPKTREVSRSPGQRASIEIDQLRPRGSWFCPDCLERGFDVDAQGVQMCAAAGTHSRLHSCPNRKSWDSPEKQRCGGGPPACGSNFQLKFRCLKVATPVHKDGLQTGSHQFCDNQLPITAKNSFHCFG